MLRPGFADPVHDAQRTFRAVLDALARPGSIQTTSVSLAPPGPLTPELAAIALALADADAPLWLDTRLAAEPEVAAYLRFHTGARIVEDPADAAFALIADPAACPAFEAFAQGSPAYPDRSATLILALQHLDGDRPSSHRHPHPEVPRSGLEGGFPGSPRELEPSFEARLRRAPRDEGGEGSGVDAWPAEVLHLSGPGIRGTAPLSASPLPADIVARLAENHALFPLGIDLILTAPGRVAGLPRSTRVVEREEA